MAERTLKSEKSVYVATVTEVCRALGIDLPLGSVVTMAWNVGSGLTVTVQRDDTTKKTVLHEEEAPVYRGEVHPDRA
jgi:hypothetical protein